MARLLIRALLAVMLVWASLPLHAQEGITTPRYRINIRGEGVIDCYIVAEEFIDNVGADSAQGAVVELRVSTPGFPTEVLDSVDLAPLTSGRGQTIRLQALLSRFAPGSRQTFEVRVLIDGQDAFSSTPRVFEQTIPPAAPECARLAVGLCAGDLSFPLMGQCFDLNNLSRDQIIFLSVVVLLTVVLLLILMRLMRALFRRVPQFGNHLPPYATVPPIDPYSVGGIRQGWQVQAQNNALLTPPTRQAAASLKLLLGADGQYLNGWKITAIRLSQYDQYGRVARTVSHAPLGLVRAVDRLAHNRRPMTVEQWEKRAAGLAKRLSSLALRRITKKSAVLPVALDIRFKGAHGEVTIVFELYQGDGAAWNLLDRWQPEMVVTGKAIYESFTYTLHGQGNGETLREFRRRLPLDMTPLLVELFTPLVLRRSGASMPGQTQTTPAVPSSAEVKARPEDPA
jgi:hypothetical protein